MQLFVVIDLVTERLTYFPQILVLVGKCYCITKAAFDIYCFMLDPNPNAIKLLGSLGVEFGLLRILFEEESSKN